MTQTNPEDDDFAGMIGALGQDLVSDNLVLALEELDKTRARIAAYEASARHARHALRALRKAGTPSEATGALDDLRGNLRAIHPSEPVVAPDTKKEG